MRYIISSILIITLALQSFAQCRYSDFSESPKELLRKRVKDNELGFRYGNPYTMFNRPPTVRSLVCWAIA